MERKHYCRLCGLEDGACICASISPGPLKIVSDHGFPMGDGSIPTDDPFDRFKNERDYVAQSGKLKTTVAAMDWAAAEIERLRSLAPTAYGGGKK